MHKGARTQNVALFIRGCSLNFLAFISYWMCITDSFNAFALTTQYFLVLMDVRNTPNFTAFVLTIQYFPLLDVCHTPKFNAFVLTA